MRFIIKDNQKIG
jgi:hypothetical protein